MKLDMTYIHVHCEYDKVRYYVFFIKTVYCRGSGFELLSAFLSLAVCHDQLHDHCPMHVSRCLNHYYVF